MTFDEPNGVGYWMIDAELEMRVEHRIACPEKGYPASEALYGSVEEWEAIKGLDWMDYVVERL